MKIGIDARSLSHPTTGIVRYTAEITTKLVERPAEFFLYSPIPLMADWEEQHNLKIRVANASLFPPMWLYQSHMPYWAGKDNIDVFWGPSHRLPIMLSARVARVVTVHDLVWKHAGDTMLPARRVVEKILMSHAIRHADLVVTDSISTAKALEVEYALSSDKIRLVYPNIVKLPALLPQEEQSSVLGSLGVHTPYILFVGTREPRKNLYRLMRAFAALGTETEGISLVIAGDKGWGGVSIEQWSRELGLDNKVVAVGRVTDQQLAALYANSLFLVMPSLYEGFGLPIVEAMTYGKAVLTSNTSSMPEVGGTAAVLVDPLDEHSISSGLKTLLNSAERSKFEAEAPKNAARFTDTDASAAKLWDIFQEAIQIRKRNARTA